MAWWMRARRWLPLALVLLLLGGAAAQEDDRRASLEADIATYNQLLEARERDLSQIDAALQDISGELKTKIDERDAISRQLGQLQQERQALLGQIDELSGQLEATQAEITLTERQLAELRGRVRGLLQSLYRQRGGGRIAGLLSEAESFHDLQVKNHYLSLLSAQDAQVITDFDAALARLSQLQATYSAQLAELRAREQTLAENEAALAQSQRQLDAVIAELNRSQEGQLANRSAALREQAEFEARLAQLNNDLQAELARLARLEEERRQREAAQAAVAARGQRQTESSAAAVPSLSELPPLSSGYIYPVESPQLLRAYGERGSSGVWLQTREEGAAVHAVQPGVVLEVGPGLANQGYVVALRHSEGLVTAYVNLQARPPVKVGQQVRQNEVIGYLGGGAAIPPNVLEFYTGWTEGGSLTWVDPARLLGF